MSSSPRFPLGRVVATPGALGALAAVNQDGSEYLKRHWSGDWGKLCREDWRANDQALVDGGRLLSAYELPDKTSLWIITEMDRSATTLLLPEEY